MNHLSPTDEYKFLDTSHLSPTDEYSYKVEKGP